jgi:hypothetical protein
MPALAQSGDSDVGGSYDAEQDSGRGSVLGDIFASVTQLGTTALLTYGPQNSGAPINPQGQAALKNGIGINAPGGTGMLATLLLLVAAVLVGFWAFKKI